ncbi:S ribonuclease [Pyrus ussuriensis x Pyrus communis]|uniref:S ribonuclease n=1 Tax=Pyrus ussuriensis x Pyrus communis TaxID=2448454 RepID=A0A5N5FSR6_9ROSA|nr:S ribonuclease [Pyrus ussuriensis x Pyrus communis]
MQRSLFDKIMSDVCNHDPYFVQKEDAFHVLGLLPEQKIMAILRMLAYGASANQVDEIARMGKTTVLESLMRFCSAIEALYTNEYLRQPTTRDMQRLLRKGEMRGFLGMIGSIDCMHWTWKNCPRAQNDLNVLAQSPVFDELLQGNGPRCTYWVNVSHLQSEKEKHFAKCQEGCRKDVERCFGILQARRAIVRVAARMFDVEALRSIMITCIILHNMIVEDEYDYDAVDEYEPDPMNNSRTQIYYAHDRTEDPVQHEPSLQENLEVKHLLKVYEDASGQAVNYQKSCVAFSDNLNEYDGQLLADCLGVIRVPYHDRYLGLPVFVGKAKKATFSYLKDILWKKLNGWRGSLLSSAGKEILIKTVAQVVPLFTMQTFLLPKTLCEELGQMVAQFWWQRELVLSAIPPGVAHDSTVDSLLVDEGCVRWNGDLITSIFYEEEAQLIQSIPLSYFKPPDRLIWVAEKDGLFSTKSAYLVARTGGNVGGEETTTSEMDGELKHMWKALWRACVPEKVKICVWRCCLDALPTRANLMRRKVITNDACQFCQGESETVEHVFLSFPRSASIWFASPLCLRTDRQLHGGFRIWLVEVAGLLARQSFDLALILIWGIWKERNSFLWNGRALNQVEIVCKSQAWLQEFRKWHDSKKGSSRTTTHKWEKPTVGWVKCNFDGAWDDLGQRGGVGVVVRDEKGDFVAATALQFRGISSAILAEIMAARAAVLFARNMGVSQMVVQEDAMMVINALQNDKVALCNGMFGNVLLDARQMLQSFQNWKATFGRRETNKVAHRLARLGLTLGTRISWFEEPSDVIFYFLVEDSIPS